jgi:cytochrome P450 family 103
MSQIDQSRQAGPPEPPIVSTAALDADPHALFRHHRALTPLIKREDGAYVVIRAGDVERLATDPRTGQLETELVQSRGVTEGALFDFFKYGMLTSNGSDHHRRRAPLSRAFASRLIAELRPRIRATAERLIDNAYRQGEMNLLDQFAAVLPATIISEILGLPEADLPRFTGWVYQFARVFSASFAHEDAAHIETAARHLTDYVSELLASRRTAPNSDFLTSYAIAVEQEGNLSPIETLIQIVTVILGGSDTTRAGMTILVALLLRHRDQWDAVCRDAALIPGAASEALRYEPPVGSFPRVTLEDLELDGYRVPRSRMLSISTLSAMRDPALYAEPDVFNIRRTDHPRRHLVFGAGAHRCLGEVLARAELEEGLAALVQRLPQLELVGAPPTIRGHAGIRRVDAMQVGWSRQMS